MLVQYIHGCTDVAVRARNEGDIKPLVRIFLKLCDQLGIARNRNGRIGCTGRIVKTIACRLISGGTATDIPACKAVVRVRRRRQIANQAAEFRACSLLDLLGRTARHCAATGSSEGHIRPDSVIRVIRCVNDINGSARKEIKLVGMVRQVRGHTREAGARHKRRCHRRQITCDDRRRNRLAVTRRQILRRRCQSSTRREFHRAVRRIAACVRDTRIAVQIIDGKRLRKARIQLQDILDGDILVRHESVQLARISGQHVSRVVCLCRLHPIDIGCIVVRRTAHNFRALKPVHAAVVLNSGCVRQGNDSLCRNIRGNLRIVNRCVARILEAREHGINCRRGRRVSRHILNLQFELLRRVGLIAICDHQVIIRHFTLQIMRIAVNLCAREVRIVDRNCSGIRFRRLAILKTVVILNPNIIQRIARNGTEIGRADKTLCRHIGRHPASGTEGVHLVLLRRVAPRWCARREIRPTVVTEAEVPVVHHIAGQTGRRRERLPLCLIGCCRLIGVGVGQICKHTAIRLQPSDHLVASPCAVRIGRQYRAIARTSSATGHIHCRNSGA